MDQEENLFYRITEYNQSKDITRKIKIIERIKNIIEKDKNKVNERNKYMETPLIYTCQSGKRVDNIEIIELLLENGADVNAKDINKNTALRECCHHHKNVSGITTKKIKLLIKYGANLNFEYLDMSGNIRSALDCLLKYSDPATLHKLVELFLENGLDVKKFNPLYESINILRSNKCEKILEDLLKYGANVNDKDGENNTPLHRFLIDYRFLDSTKENNQKYIKIFTILLKDFKNMNIKNNSGHTLLSLFIQDLPLSFPFLEIFNLLLERNNNINITIGNDENTILHILIDRCCEYMIGYRTINYGDVSRIIELLLEKGIDANKTNKCGYTPLHKFLERYYDRNLIYTSKVISIIKILLEYTDINITNHGNYSINKMIKKSKKENIPNMIITYKYKKKIKELEEKIAKLEKENEDLKYVPGNPKYFETMEDFDKLRRNII